MPTHPPRSLEAYKKKELLARREEQLRHALSSGAAPAKVSRAAENLRAAQLAILKAEQELIRYRVETEEKHLRMASIAEKRATWQAMPAEEIIDQYRASRGGE